MINVEVDLRSLNGLENLIGDLRKGVDGKFRPAYHGTVKVMENYVLKKFDERSRQGGWKPISMTTAVLRVKGKTKGAAGEPRKFKKFETLGEVMKKAKEWQPLASSGLLRASIRGSAKGKKHHVERLKEVTVSVGTKLEYAKIHQTGGTSTFRFDEEARKRFEMNFLKVKKGAKPSTTPTGRTSRAKKNWNRDYFIMQAILKGKDGKTTTIPARVFLPDKGDDLSAFSEKLARVMDKGIQIVLEGDDGA